MIYVYFPCVLAFISWCYIAHFSVLFSLFLTPISYLAINGFLIYKQQFNMVHGLVDKLIIFRYIETMFHLIGTFLVYLLFLLPYVNKIYSWLKIKILLYVFNTMTSFVPEKKTDVLRSELQNDYMDILNRNRRPRTVSFADTTQVQDQTDTHIKEQEQDNDLSKMD